LLFGDCTKLVRTEGSSNGKGSIYVKSFIQTIQSYKQITSRKKLQCQGEKSGMPDQCLEKTGSDLQSCCLQSCTESQTCDGVWYRPEYQYDPSDPSKVKHETCLLFGDCTKLVRTASSSNGTGSIYVKSFIQTIQEEIPSDELFQGIQSYTEITVNSKTQCKDAKAKPAQCLDTTGPAARSCCAQACTEDPTCDGIWWRPEQNGKSETCELFGDCTDRVNTAGSGKGRGNIYKKKFI